jgi:hypothetical protein
MLYILQGGGVRNEPMCQYGTVCCGRAGYPGTARLPAEGGEFRRRRDWTWERTVRRDGDRAMQCKRAAPPTASVPTLHRCAESD